MNDARRKDHIRQLEYKLSQIAEVVPRACLNDTHLGYLKIARILYETYPETLAPEMIRAIDDVFADLNRPELIELRKWALQMCPREDYQHFTYARAIVDFLKNG